MKTKNLIVLLALIFISGNLFSQRSDNEAYHLVDSLFWVIQKDTNKFCEIIEQFSDDPGSKENCGFYDWMNGDLFVPEIKNRVRNYSGNRGISPPIKTAFGYHLVQSLGTRKNEIRFKHLLISIEE
jgi:hypothetical protein